MRRAEQMFAISQQKNTLEGYLSDIEDRLLEAAKKGETHINYLFEPPKSNSEHWLHKHVLQQLVYFGYSISHYQFNYKISFNQKTKQ